MIMILKMLQIKKNGKKKHVLNKKQKDDNKRKHLTVLVFQKYEE